MQIVAMFQFGARNVIAIRVQYSKLCFFTLGGQKVWVGKYSRPDYLHRHAIGHNVVLQLVWPILKTIK